MVRRDQNIQKRVRLIRDGKRGDGPVVYWLSRSFRVRDNWTLLYAIQEAVIRDTGLVVVTLDLQRPYENIRQDRFNHAGMAALANDLRGLGVAFYQLRGGEDTLSELLRLTRACQLVCDFNPLKEFQKLLKTTLQLTDLPVSECDSRNIIPVWVASNKKEYGAYTLRPKINRLRTEYLTEIPTPQKIDVQPMVELPDGLRRTPQKNGESVRQPGETGARQAMAEAIKLRLAGYAQKRNDPLSGKQSALSIYLAGGQLSAQRLALEVLASQLGEADQLDFLEELIVRRELADNFCTFEPHYDSFQGLHEWARVTLDTHRGDTREYLYDQQTFEQAQTHDPLWNGCQIDLLESGTIPGYLRMYWAKKILEWSETPEQALQISLNLNDRYSLDGRDPNGYTGVAWAIGGIHDRAWKERPVFGKIRYMNARGCRRKFDVDGYIQKVTGNRGTISL
ncbi:MAG: deoxyribodipyrimidine photolyase [Desulfobulbaceae bacterium]|nr:MAG: deoxyribodipyrimidine photolyase [Desulfobulbaceae bacterium]